jgi:low affinity Fe/Cu permease
MSQQQVASERDSGVKAVDEAVRGDPQGTNTSLSEIFRRLACASSNMLGTHWAFIAGLSLVIGWAASGPLFDFGDGWQLFINTTTTIMTFLMVFLIQATQNRDAKAIHLKLDELIRSSKARDTFADLEDATDEELDAFKHEFEQLRKGRLKELRGRPRLKSEPPRSG